MIDSDADATEISLVENVQREPMHPADEFDAFKALVDSGTPVSENPARLLFTPKEAKKPVRKVMTIEEVQECFNALGRRERLIAKLAILAGMRPGKPLA